MRKTWIKVKRGILEPKHIDALGPAWIRKAKGVINENI